MQVANALAVEFSLEEQQALERAPTSSPEAYALYLQARVDWLTDGFASVRNIDRAIAIDPDFALAHSAKATALGSSLISVSGQNAVSDAEQAARIELARQHAERAVEIDPTLATPYAVLGQINSVSWRWTEALEAYDRAGTEASGNSVWLRSYRGEHAEIIAEMERRVAEEMDDPAYHWTLGTVLAYGGETALARSAIRDAIALSPVIPVFHTWLAFVELALGNVAEAEREIRLSEQLMADNRTVASLTELAYVYSRVGAGDDALRVFNEVEGLAANLDIGAGAWAMAYLAIGDQRSALEQFEIVAEKVSRREIDQGFFNIMNLKMNVTADPVLEQPEFVTLRNRIRGD